MEREEMCSGLVGKLLEKRRKAGDRIKMAVRKIGCEGITRMELAPDCVVNAFQDMGSPTTATEIIPALTVEVLTPL
jgi:hypothetical protein